MNSKNAILIASIVAVLAVAAVSIPAFDSDGDTYSDNLNYDADSGYFLLGGLPEGTTARVQYEAVIGTIVTTAYTVDMSAVGYGIVALVDGNAFNYNVDSGESYTIELYTFENGVRGELVNTYTISPTTEPGPEPTPDTFDVVINQPENGSVTADVDEGIAGTQVTVTIMADEGFELEALYVNGEDVTSEVTDGTYTFILEGDVTITATFKEVATPGPGGDDDDDEPTYDPDKEFTKGLMKNKLNY